MDWNSYKMKKKKYKRNYIIVDKSKFERQVRT